MQWLRACSRGSRRRQRHPATEVFLVLEGLLVILATYEIVGTIYVMVYGPKDQTKDMSKVLTLVASTLSLNYPVLHWCIFSAQARKQLGRRTAHPAAILYLCLLCCLWIASTPSIIQKAFDPRSCNRDSVSIDGPMKLSICRLGKVGAIIAGVMATLTFVLLQFVTCCSHIFVTPIVEESQVKEEAPTTCHHRSSSSRALSDSQTLRPSHDISFVLHKPTPVTESAIRPLPESLPTIASAVESPDLGFDPNQDYFTSQFRTLTRGDSQTNLLPSPLHPLPRLPDRASHPMLQRTRTDGSWSSSVYSRSVSTDFLSPSRQVSPLGSFSADGARSPSLRSIPSRSPTPYQEHRASNLRPAPLINTMPKKPASFSRPGPDYITDQLDSGTTHQSPLTVSLRQLRPSLLSSYLPVTLHDHADTTVGRSHVKSEPGCRAFSTPSEEVPRESPLQTPEPLKYTSPYEQLRKKTQSPKWQGEDGLAARIAESRANAEREKFDSGRTKSQGRKVSKKRKPSTAF